MYVETQIGPHIVKHTILKLGTLIAESEAQYAKYFATPDEMTLAMATRFMDFESTTPLGSGHPSLRNVQAAG